VTIKQWPDVVPLNYTLFASINNFFQ